MQRRRQRAERKHTRRWCLAMTCPRQLYHMLCYTGGHSMGNQLQLLCRSDSLTTGMSPLPGSRRSGGYSRNSFSPYLSLTVRTLALEEFGGAVGRHRASGQLKWRWDRRSAYEGESVGANWGFQWTIATQCGPGQARPTSSTSYALDLRRADALWANRLLGLGAFHSALSLPMPVGVTCMAMQLFCAGQ